MYGLSVCLSVCLCHLITTHSVCSKSNYFVCTQVFSGFGFFLYLTFCLFCCELIVLLLFSVEFKTSITVYLYCHVFVSPRSMVSGCYLTSLTTGGVNADDSVCELVLFFIYRQAINPPPKKKIIFKFSSQISDINQYILYMYLVSFGKDNNSIFFILEFTIWQRLFTSPLNSNSNSNNVATLPEYLNINFLLVC